MAPKLAKPPQNSSSSNSSSSDGGGGAAATTFFSGHNMKKIPLKPNKNCPYLFYPCPNESACFFSPSRMDEVHIGAFHFKSLHVFQPPYYY
jgi:hypothetical protein